jgi:cysteine desulfurase
MHYLDANATEPLRPAARTALVAALDATGNPSSVHTAGRTARRIMEDAREALAARFGAHPADLVFTSGGTEADALAIHALGAGRRIIIGATEHDAVRAAAPDATVLPVDRNGVADLEVLAALLRDGPPALLCLMLANNETGTIQPVAAAAALCRQHGARLHVDAVQAAGRMAVDLAALGADSIAISSHKLGGPAGAGALLLASTAGTIAPLIRGGGQERGRRGGTPPVPVIAGFAAAAQAAGQAMARELSARAVAPGLADAGATGVGDPGTTAGAHGSEAAGIDIALLRDAAEAAACAHGAIVCGGSAPRLPNTTCLALPGVRADAQVIALDLDGIAVSAGAACSSGKVAASHVLAAMGLGVLAGQAIRVSLPWNVTPDAIAAFAAAYARMSGRLRLAATFPLPLREEGGGRGAHIRRTASVGAPPAGPVPQGEGENLVRADA